jgi:hypothetical protein
MGGEEQAQQQLSSDKGSNYESKDEIQWFFATLRMTDCL